MTDQVMGNDGESELSIKDLRLQLKLRLTNFIEKEIGRSIGQRKKNILNDPENYKWRFSPKYPRFPAASIASLSFADLKACGRALDNNWLSVVDASNITPETSETPNSMVHDEGPYLDQIPGSSDEYRAENSQDFSSFRRLLGEGLSSVIETTLHAGLSEVYDRAVSKVSQLLEENLRLKQALRDQETRCKSLTIRNEELRADLSRETEKTSVLEQRFESLRTKQEKDLLHLKEAEERRRNSQRDEHEALRQYHEKQLERIKEESSQEGFEEGRLNTTRTRLTLETAPFSELPIIGTVDDSSLEDVSEKEDGRKRSDARRRVSKVKTPGYDSKPAQPQGASATTKRQRLEEPDSSCTSPLMQTRSSTSGLIGVNRNSRAA